MFVSHQGTQPGTREDKAVTHCRIGAHICPQLWASHCSEMPKIQGGGKGGGGEVREEDKRWQDHRVILQIRKTDTPL